jgi:DNA-binding NarL/FixJ family response regulator
MREIISVLIVSSCNDDQNQVVAQLSNQNDFYVAGVVKDETDAIIKSAKIKPDVVILDLKRSGIDGTELAPIILRKSPSSKIILMCSDKEGEHYVCKAQKAGISGYIIKKTDIGRLELIIKMVHSGGLYYNSSVIKRVFNAVLLMEYFPGQFGHNLEFGEMLIGDCPSFSSTERSIAICLARGYQDKEIAEYLHLHVGSIRNCMTSIRHKTKLKSRVLIIIFFLKYGIINFDDLII